MDSYFGLYYQVRNQLEEQRALNQRLKVMLMEYQNIILDQSQLISSLRENVCYDHTSVTYVLPQITTEI